MCGDKSRPSNEEDHQPRESSHHLHQIHHAAGAAAGGKERSETEEDADSDLGCTVRIGEDTSSYAAAAASSPLGTASPPSIVAGFASAVAAEEESAAATVAALFRLMTNLDRCLSSASLKNPDPIWSTHSPPLLEFKTSLSRCNGEKLVVELLC